MSESIGAAAGRWAAGFILTALLGVAAFLAAEDFRAVHAQLAEDQQRITTVEQTLARIETKLDQIEQSLARQETKLDRALDGRRKR